MLHSFILILLIFWIPTSSIHMVGCLYYVSLFFVRTRVILTGRYTWWIWVQRVVVDSKLLLQEFVQLLRNRSFALPISILKFLSITELLSLDCREYRSCILYCRGIFLIVFLCTGCRAVELVCTFWTEPKQPLTLVSGN